MYKTAKRILGIFLLLAMLLSIIPCVPILADTQENGLDLSGMQIVLPSTSTRVEDTAATELKRYLLNITGESFRTVIEGEHQGPAIYLGNTAFAQQHGVTYPTQNDTNGEAWVIQVVDGNLVLCGAPERGALYAVYHLLEDCLGVRWWNPWEQEIPQGKAIIPRDYFASGVPAMEFRETFIGVVEKSDEAFYASSRLNGGLLNISPSYGDKEAYGAPAHTHTFNLYFPEHFDTTNKWLNQISDTKGDITTHPEWYAMDDKGQRVYNGHLCLSNEGLQQEFATRVVRTVAYCYNEADFQRKDRPNYFAIVPPDSTSFCQCDNCKAEIQLYGMSGYILKLVNYVAQAVAEAGYTDALIEMAAYASYKDAPTGGIVPLENVQIRFCDSGRDLLHGINHPNNADSLARAQQWAQIAPNNLYNWQYVVNYNNNGVFPSMFYYGDEITTLYEMGFNGWFAEQEHCINADFWDMKFWLINQLMEKPVTGEEYTALMDAFIYGYYGEAAGAHIRDYLYYMHDRAEATDTYQTFGTHIITTQWLNVEDIITGYGHFEKAFAAAGKDATLLRRLRSARSGFDRVVFENFGVWQSQAAEKGLTLPFTKREVGERLSVTFTEQIALRGDYDIDYDMYCYRYDQYNSNLAAVPAELNDIPREHIIEFDTNDFRYNYGDVVVDDPDSLTGKAVRSDGGSRLASGNKALILTSGKGITLSIYDPAPISDSSALSVGSIQASDIKVGEGYQLYTLQWTVPAVSLNSYLYIYSDWGLQCPQMPIQLQDMVGQTVTVCVSLKAEGVIDGSDPENYPVYYIDRVFVVPTGDALQHNYQRHPGVTEDGVCKVACTVCGDVLENIHIWDSGKITKEPTAWSQGELVYTCVGCHKTDVQVLASVPGTTDGDGSVVVLIGAGALLLAAMAVLLIALVKKRNKQ